MYYKYKKGKNREKKNRRGKQKTNSKRIDLNLTVSTST